MPAYDYKCNDEKCNHEFTATHRMSEPKPDCPECGEKVSVQFKSAPPVSLKGSGWTGKLCN